MCILELLKNQTWKFFDYSAVPTDNFYGTDLYELRDATTESLCAAWRNSVKLSWDVNRGCHTYLLHHIIAPELTPVEASLMSKFHNFFLNSLSSPSHEVRVMALLSARDMQSTFGSNVKLLQEMTGLDPWMTQRDIMRAALRY